MHTIKFVKKKEQTIINFNRDKESYLFFRKKENIINRKKAHEGTSNLKFLRNL